MITTIVGAVPFTLLGTLCAQDDEAKFRWLLCGSVVSAILLGVWVIMRHLSSKEDSERMAAAEARAQAILDKAKDLTSRVGMKVCDDGVFCEPEVHDRALARLALELGAAGKPLVPPAGG